MTLSAINVNTAVATGGVATQIPRALAAKLTLSAANTLGYTFTNSGDGACARYVQIASQDGQWYLHDVDAQAVADCRAIPINTAYEFQIPPNSTVTLFLRSVGTVNVVPTVER